jgi:polar amino acid transport system substrate-binding protein
VNSGANILRLGLGLTALALALAATATGSPDSASQVRGCAKATLPLVTPGQLTLATDNPLRKPWWNGPATRDPWKGANPYTAKGYESAVAYAIAKRLGFIGRQVTWMPVPQAQALQPGSKPFDFYLGQVTYGSVRDRDVDFSYGYYNLPIAFLSPRTNPYSKARNLPTLKRLAYFGLVAGTTGHRYVDRWIKPSQGPIYYDTYESALSGLAFGQVSGIATDLPTAYALRPRVAGGGVIVGQFPKKGTPQRFALVFAQGSKLRACVNKALAQLTNNGTIKKLQTRWLNPAGGQRVLR